MGHRKIKSCDNHRPGDILLITISTATLIICPHTFGNQPLSESVDSLCRDGADPPIVRVHRKAFLTRECSRSKPFCAPSYSIPAFLYPKIPPK